MDIKLIVLFVLLHHQLAVNNHYRQQQILVLTLMFQLLRMRREADFLAERRAEVRAQNRNLRDEELAFYGLLHFVLRNERSERRWWSFPDQQINLTRLRVHTARWVNLTRVSESS